MSDSFYYHHTKTITRPSQSRRISEVDSVSNKQAHHECWVLKPVKTDHCYLLHCMDSLPVPC
jgi:hypothetical protein